MIITQAGQAAIADALANSASITITEVGFGTVDRQPTGTEVALANEVLRKPITNTDTDQGGTRTFIEAVIETNEGPFVLFEVGVFSDDGTLLFIGRLDALNKPVNPDQAVDAIVRVFILTDNFQNVIVEVNTQFSAIPSDRLIATDTGLKGGGDMSENRLIALDFDALPDQTGAAVDLTNDTFAMHDVEAEGQPRHAKITTAELGNALLRLSGFNFTPTSRFVLTGAGLTGGGNMTANRTISLAINTLPVLDGANVDLGADYFGLYDAFSGGSSRHARINTNEVATAILRTQVMRDALAPSVNGPTTIYSDTANDYTITDYHAWSVWAVSVDVGTVTRAGEVITVSIPDGETATDMTLTVTRDNKTTEVPINILAKLLNAPTIEAPADGTTNVGETPVLATSAFSVQPAGGDTHASTSWQVATDAAFTNVVWQSINDMANLETITVPEGELVEGATYYVRAEHFGTDLGGSGYSAATSFSTAPNFLARDVFSHFYGNVVGVDGDYLVVGQPFDTTNGSSSGGGKVFERDGSGAWQDAGNIYPSGAGQNKRFGGAVSISGNTVIMGEEWGDEAYIFDRDGAGVWSETQRLDSGFNGGGTYIDVAIDGDTAIVAGEDHGVAFWERDGGGVWQLGTVVPEDGEIGSAVAISGDRAVIGAMDDNSFRGRAYVYVRSGPNWVLEDELEHADGTNIYQYGLDVDISGDYAIVGNRNSAQSRAECAHVFKRVGSTWSLLVKLTGVGAVSGDKFGEKVAISGTRIAVAADYDDQGGNNRGAVYLFERDGADIWAEITKIVNTDHSFFGRHIDLTGNRMAVGQSAQFHMYEL